MSVRRGTLRVDPVAHRVRRDGVAPRSDWQFSRWLFLRVLGLTYLAAFASLWDYAPGLVGPQGIEPCSVWLAELRAEHGGLAFLRAPTLLLWSGAGALQIQALSAVGIAAAGLLTLNLAPKGACAALWLAYLAFTAAEPPGELGFFNWPPDEATLEIGFLAIWLAPWGLRPGCRGASAPPGWARWLLYFALFKLMFGSGFTKIVREQAAWMDLTAIWYDHLTRPHPAYLAHFAYHAPMWLQKASALVTYVVEVPLPVLYFVAGWPRRAAALAGIALMLGIAATGNYRWFNLVTLGALCMLLDDRLLLRSVPELWRARLAERRRFGITRPRLDAALGVLLVALVGGVGGVKLFDQLAGYRGPRQHLPGIRAAIDPFRTINTYGLFGDVLLERKVLVFQGSDDGQEWRTYELFSNPDQLDKVPGYFAPYHQYLDFRLWSAAHAPCQDQQSLVGGIVLRLLEGEPSVLRMFAVVPFASPPRQVRVLRYRYDYSSPAERAAGQWWRRTQLEDCCPPVTLQDGQLRIAAR